MIIKDEFVPDQAMKNLCGKRVVQWQTFLTWLVTGSKQ
jgi:hypothetical protein